MEPTNSALILPSESTEPALSDIHDIRSLVEVPSSWAWLWWVLVAALLLGLLYWGLVYWRKKRQQHGEEETAVPREPAHERARRSLEEALAFLHDPDHFCVLVSHAIRVYLEERFELHAPERTTEEFLEELRESHHLSQDQKDSLANFLMECDMVKFAKSEREAFELKRLHESALQLVQETEPSLLERPTEEAEGTTSA